MRSADDTSLYLGGLLRCLLHSKRFAFNDTSIANLEGTLSSALCSDHVKIIACGQQMIVNDLSFIEEKAFKAWEWAIFKAQMERKSPTQATMPRNRRSLSRRPNACVPCKRSKLKVGFSAVLADRSDLLYSAMVVSLHVQHARKSVTKPSRSAST